MKLSFSTLGCPDWSFERVVKTAVELGYDGIEIRGIEREYDLTKRREFYPNEIERTRDSLERQGIEVACIGASSRFHMEDDDERERNMEEAKGHIRLAQKVDAPFVRVFGDRILDISKKGECISRIAECLRELGRYAGDLGVKVLLETHGDFCSSLDVKSIIEEAEEKNVGVLWDTHHPFRLRGEPVEETLNRLGKWVEHTHFKDSIAEDGGHRLVPLGEGDVPVRKILALLKGIGYQGYLSFEWEKSWHPELEEPEVVFPHYIKTMKEYLTEI